MTRIKLMLNVLAVSVVCVLFSSMAHAQATRTWVSGVGDDANPCSRTAPCKTFAGAISKTAAGGEISVLDPGGFGGVTITKSITLNGDGTLAGILATGFNGIIINAAATDVVIIRSLSIVGNSTGGSAIRILAAKHVHVENCSLVGFSGGTSSGIEGANAAAVELSVANTSITNCRNGILVSAAAGNTTSVTGVNIQRGVTGLDIQGGTGTVRDSVVAHQTNVGLAAEGSGVLNVASCAVTNNTTGVSAFTAGSTIRIANCEINNNTTGVSVAGGATGERFGNNRITGNGTAITGTLTLTGNQ